MSRILHAPTGCPRHGPKLVMVDVTKRCKNGQKYNCPLAVRRDRFYSAGPPVHTINQLTVESSSPIVHVGSIVVVM